VRCQLVRYALVIAMPAPRDIDVGVLLGRGALAPMLSTLIYAAPASLLHLGRDQPDQPHRREQLSSRSSCRISSVTLSNDIARDRRSVTEAEELFLRLTLSSLCKIGD
jgi:hypothetical protein